MQSELEVKEDDDHETAESLNTKENVDNRDIRRKKKKKKRKTNRLCYNARSSEDNFEVPIRVSHNHKGLS